MFQNVRIEPKEKTIHYHWPETDRIGIREGYTYDKNLRAHITNSLNRLA